MSRTIKKQPKRERPRAMRPEGIKKSTFKRHALSDNIVDSDEEFQDL
jgi:hypothetical protein